MKLNNLDDIEDLAQRVVFKYSKSLPTDLVRIAEKINVKIIFEPYQDHFKGFICFDGQFFYIILNSQTLTNINYTEARFTLAHEFGHYFIGTHRNKLKSGESFAFTGTGTLEERKKLEREADQFAASLLMPKAFFTNQYQKINVTGFGAILSLSKQFEVSITSCLIRFNTLDILPCISVVWTNTTIKGKGVSIKFNDILKSLGYSDEVKIKINPKRSQLEKKNVLHEQTQLTYSRSITPLSSWIYDIDPLIGNEYFIVEETLVSSRVNITLLYPADMKFQKAS